MASCEIIHEDICQSLIRNNKKPSGQLTCDLMVFKLRLSESDDFYKFLVS